MQVSGLAPLFCKLSVSHVNRMLENWDSTRITVNSEVTQFLEFCRDGPLLGNERITSDKRRTPPVVDSTSEGHALHLTVG
jgi:hypothetical protein